MKKIILLVIIGVLTLSAITGGQSITVSVLSKYVALMGLIPHHEPVAQANISLPLSARFYGNIWASTGFDTKNNFGKEIDWTLGYIIKEQNGTFFNEKFDVSLSYFDLDKVFSSAQADCIQPAVSYRATLKIPHPVNRAVSLFFSNNYFYITKETKTNSALITRLGLDIDWGQQLDLGNFSSDFWLLYDGGVFGYSNEGFVANVLFSYLLTIEKIRISPLTRLSLPFSNVEGKETQVVLGIKFEI